MNPLKHIFVLILLLLAGLQVEAAHGEGSKTAGDFKYCLLNNSFNQPSWELDLIAYFRPIQELQKYSDTTSQYISPCDQIPEEEAFTSPPGSLAPKVLCMLAEDLAKFPELRKLFDSAENVGGKFVRAWEGLINTPQVFRTNVSKLETVSKYIDDFGKSGNDIASEIASSTKGHQWWFDYVLGRKYWTEFLNNPSNAQQFADEIIDLNRATEGRGILLSGSPSSAINTALYYDDVLEQGASIFKTIIKNHMFADGNKRTAVDMYKSFMNKAGIPLNKTDTELLNIATQVATNQLDEVPIIANKIIE